MRIGTRDSKLAVWQAEKVQSLLLSHGQSSELVFLKSPADTDLKTPLHQFGGTGIFTKILDDALLNNTIDLAVHSLKDYPTVAPKGIHLPAVLERASYHDIIVHKGDANFLKNGTEANVATGSIRRIAQWKSKYPNHQMQALRGNVQTRLKKLEESNWQGAIFAKAGLERIDILPNNHVVLDWMIPAPAQGVIGITCLEENEELSSIIKQLNHQQTFEEATMERDFLNAVEGGCSAPVGALAITENQQIKFKAGVFELNGKMKVIFEGIFPVDNWNTAGRKAAEKVLNDGGREIMQSIKNA